MIRSAVILLIDIKVVEIVTNVPEIFSSLVFNETVMEDKLPRETYKVVKKTIEQGIPLDPAAAAVVANAMKDWAISKGATHYTHWFQPLTGITAEKHDSFITPVNNGVIMDLTGKELIKGEPDASSFPSGGLRATFEARGYTAWDPTSFAFIKDGVLCIPTAFCSYGGEALDKKTPLLRSMDALNTQALRVLRLFGNNTVKRVIPTVGPEQEYFLIDKKLYDKRKDLIFTGRTLFGANPPKGQELEDHYFGAIKPRVAAFMAELDEELWKLGIFAKTEHNEAAPAQHELAPIFTSMNIATDHNQLTMETMKKVAQRHGLVCLLHEKPFEGVNGSGKHNNWSLSTDNGKNLFDPGKTPSENAQFLLFLAAVIKAVDDFAPLMRCSIASAGNDHRLGANEAPPAIVSMFLGDELTEILDCIVKDVHFEAHKSHKMKLGLDIIPAFPKDNTDRNRTSPFAFTGNKFEFRMLGSAASIADTNTILNTIIAEELKQFADILENAEDFTTALNELIKNTVKEHNRVIFNGDGYSTEWEEEASRRGLPNLRTTVDCLPYMVKPEYVKVFGEHKVFTETELKSRLDIELETYSKVINIEALTSISMIRKEIIPAVIEYIKDITTVAANKATIGANLNNSFEQKLISRLSDLMTDLYNKCDLLDNEVQSTTKCSSHFEKAELFKNKVIPAMNDCRKTADELETIVGKKYWPFPTYSDLLFRV